MAADSASYLASADTLPTEKVEMGGVFIYQTDWPLLAVFCLSRGAEVDPKQPLDVDPFKREGRGGVPNE
jgi:hypothetical protein